MDEKELLAKGFTEEQIKLLKESKLLIDPESLGKLKDEDLPDHLKRIIEKAAKERSDIVKGQLYDTINKLKEDNQKLTTEFGSVKDFVTKKQTEEEAAARAAEEKAKKEKEDQLKTAPVEDRLQELAKTMEEKTTSVQTEAEKQIKELKDSLHVESMRRHKLELLGTNPDQKVADLMPKDAELLDYTQEELKELFDKASSLVKSIREETEKSLKEELKKKGIGEEGITKKETELREPGTTMTNLFLGKTQRMRSMNKYDGLSMDELKEKSKELVGKL